MEGRDMIAGRNLGKSFSGISVLRNIDFALRSNEVHAIVGENGAGKSTLAKIFGGVFPQNEGEILLQGEPIRFANPKQALQHGIALIHQEPLTFANLSVAENVFVGNQPTKAKVSVDWKSMHEKAAALFESLGVKIDTHRSAGGLSVADQQMIELASALNHEAKVIIFDETTASLTPKEVAELFIVVRRLKEQGCAIAIVTHRLDEVFTISDRITVLRDGAKVWETLTSETNGPEVVKQMVGREFEFDALHTGAETFGDTVLEVENLGCKGNFQNVSFKVRAGEVVGIAGLVGAGRTELCETIFGVRKATEGTIKFKGAPVQIKSPRDAIQVGMAMVPEDRQHNGLVLPFGIKENITMASPGLISKLGWLTGKTETELAQGEAVAVGLKFSGLAQPVGQLSGGNQQKVTLAKWLVTDPRLLILDEPTRGVDIGAKTNIHLQIGALARTKGLAILMVSSDLNEVLGQSDRILVMRAGRITHEFTAQEATPENVMLAATGQVPIAS